MMLSREMITLHGMIMLKKQAIAESTYELNTSLLQEGFENRLRSLFNKGDNVDYISVNKDNDLYWKKIII